MIFFLVVDFRQEIILFCDLMSHRIILKLQKRIKSPGRLRKSLKCENLQGVGSARNTVARMLLFLVFQRNAQLSRNDDQ